MQVRKPIDIACGSRYGRLTILRQAESRSGSRCWHAACDCGNETIVRSSSLSTGKTRSCGCLMREIHSAKRPQITTHGMTGTPTYRTWTSMWIRCTYPATNDYARYGGRGIAVCERWASFSNFFADMGERPAGMTLDRWPNKDGNYEPGNCRWASLVDQARNRSNNVLLIHGGVTATIAEWAERVGMRRATLGGRLRAGWDVGRALNEPSRKRA